MINVFKDAKGLELVGLITLALFMVLAVTALGGLLTMLVWNLALVPVVAACGGTVAKISFWVAIGVNFLTYCIGNILHPPRKKESA